MADDPKLSQDDVQDAAEALIGIGIAANFFRTIWDTLLWPNKVLAAAFANDQSRYIRPFRLFVMMFGLQVLLTTFIGLPILGDLETLTTALTQEQFAEVLANSGAEESEVQGSLRFWIDLSLWPLTLLTLVPYLILFKLFRPKRTIYGSFLANLVAVNALYIVFLPTLPILFVSPHAFMVAFTLTFVWYMVALGRIVARYYAETMLGTSIKIFWLLLITPLSFGIIWAAQLGIIEVVLQSHSLSLLDFIPPEAAITETPPS